MASGELFTGRSGAVYAFQPFLAFPFDLPRRSVVAGPGEFAAGVLFINVIANGLLLIGWNFYWQQVATGVLIFLVLTFSFASRRAVQSH